MTELLDSLPDRLLLLFRSKLASRLRSDTGLHGIMKMAKLVPAVAARARATKHTAMHRSMSSILDTHSSMNGLLDTSSNGDLQLLDSAFALSLDKQPVGHPVGLPAHGTLIYVMPHIVYPRLELDAVALSACAGVVTTADYCLTR